MSEIFELMERRFTSLNSVPVERAHITGEEWNQIKAALAQSGQGAEVAGLLMPYRKKVNIFLRSL